MAAKKQRERKLGNCSKIKGKKAVQLINTLMVTLIESNTPGQGKIEREDSAPKNLTDTASKPFVVVNSA